MADRTVTVKASGGDYTSLNAALAGETKDLVGNARILTIECYGFADYTAADTGTEWTVSSSCHINIVTPAGARHAGAWNTSVYRLITSGSVGFRNRENYTRVNGVQIESTGSTTCLAVDNAGGGANALYDSLIVKSSSTAVNNVGVMLQGPGTLRNSIVYGFGTTGSSGVKDRWGTGSACVLQNVTIADCITGFDTWRSSQATNVLIANCTTCFLRSGGSTTWTYCASSDATADDQGGAGNRVNQTFSFVDAANKNFHLFATDAGAKGFGTDLSASFTLDVDGQTRDATWDIGADQFVEDVVANYSSDTLAIALTEQASIAASLGATESLLPLVTDSPLLSAHVLAAENVLVRLTEAVSLAAAVLGTETLAVRLAESPSLDGSDAKAVSDTLGVLLADTPGLAAGISGADTLALSLAQGSVVIIDGLVIRVIRVGRVRVTGPGAGRVTSLGPVAGRVTVQ